MTDRRLHNDCDSGQCIACRSDEIVAMGAICKTCYWWLDGVCRAYRPSAVYETHKNYTCGLHTFDSPYWRDQIHKKIDVPSQTKGD